MRKIFLNTILVFSFFIVSNEAIAKFYSGNKRECPILYDLSNWEYIYITGGGEYWGRNQDWFDSEGWTTATGDGIFLDKKHKSYSIQKDEHNSSVLVYIGPWKKVTLTKGSFFNKEKIETEIRMIASQNGKYLENHYETKDELNSKIPEQKFTLLEEPNDLIVKCDILRAQKFGYNAVSDLHVNIFRAYLGKSILAGSGKIIDSETGEIIADEKGNLISHK